MHRWGKHTVVAFAALVAMSGIGGIGGIGAIDASPAAAAASAADAVAGCRSAIGTVPQVGERSCRSVEQVLRGFANGCRNLGQADTCAVFDGRQVGPSHMQAYAKSWTHRALTLQRELDDDVAFARSTILHTHNTFNSPVYAPPTLTNQDPNQIYSIFDQLQMDIRAIEMDVHWVPSAYGTANTGFNAVTLCHGQVQAGVHLGCTIDRPLEFGLAELRNWLEQPENKREVVLLYLENNLDENVLAHDLVAQALQRGLGDLIVRPPADKPCTPLPTLTTPATLRAAGHRVIIVSDCGPGAWGSWVFERGDKKNWVESGSGPGDDYPGLKTGCATERKRVGSGQAIVRWYEDSTWLTAMVEGDSPQLTSIEASKMAACGATLIGFDQLTPEDPRLNAVVWSWAKNEPVQSAGRCATSAPDSYFHAKPCTEQRLSFPRSGGHSA